MDNARRSGIDVTCDVYPYSASSTDLTTCLPPWVREGGTEKMLERIKDAGTRIQIRKEMESNKMQGVWADLVVFEPSVIQDTATYEEPAQFPLGIKYVIVNGVVVVSEGRHTDATPGRLLKHS
jgi:N-acyl-D-aspartate/D-glutamate deacylase